MLEEEDLQSIGEKFETVGRKLIKETKRKKPNELIKLIKKRLFAYPQLQKNIERYRLDIKDIKRELNFGGKSKSIVVFQPTYAEPLTEADKKAAAIAIIEQKINRDQQEINEIGKALKEIKDEPYFQIIELRFFKNIRDRKIIGDIVGCEGSTVTRNIGKLLTRMSIILYGADALH